MQQHHSSQNHRNAKRRRSSGWVNLRCLTIGLICFIALPPMVLQRERFPSKHRYSTHFAFHSSVDEEVSLSATDHRRLSRDAWRSLRISGAGSANASTLFRYLNEHARLDEGSDPADESENRAILNRMALGDWRDGRWPAHRDAGCIELRLANGSTALVVQVRFTCENDYDDHQENFDGVSSPSASKRFMWPSAWFYPTLCTLRAFHRLGLLKTSLSPQEAVIVVCPLAVEHLDMGALVQLATQGLEWARNQTEGSCEHLPSTSGGLDIVESFPTSVAVTMVPHTRHTPLPKPAVGHFVFLLGEMHSEKLVRSLVEAVLAAEFQWSDVCSRDGRSAISCANQAPAAAKDSSNVNGLPNDRGSDVLCTCLPKSPPDAAGDAVDPDSSFEWLTPWVSLAKSNVVSLTVSFEHRRSVTISIRVSQQCWNPLHREVLREVVAVHKSIAAFRRVTAVVALSYCTLPLLCQWRTDGTQGDAAVWYDSVMLLPPPGFPQFERSAVEETLSECSLLLGQRQPPHLLWYRPHEDTQPPTPRAVIEYHPWDRLWMVPGYYRTNVQAPQSGFPAKDATELAVEAVLASRPIDGPERIPLSRNDDAPGVGHLYEGRRTMYDPDFFVLQPQHQWILARASPEVLTHVLSCLSSSLPQMWSNFSTLLRQRPRGYSDFEWALVASKDDVGHVATIDDFRPLANATPLPRGAPNSARRRRKRQLLLGNLSLARLAWHTENRDPLVDLALFAMPIESNQCPVGAEQLAQASATPWTTYFHYPWVRDNLYHLHNDNLLPLLLAIAQVEKRQSQARCRRLVLLPSHRKQPPLPVAEHLFALLFDEVVELVDAAQHNNSTAMEAARVTPGARRGGPPSCVINKDNRSSFRNGTLTLRGDLVWGRPRRPFSSVMRDVAPYVRNNVVLRWRQLVYEEAAAALANSSGEETDSASVECGPDSGDPCVITVTWLSRKGERALQSEGALLAWIEATTGELLRARYGCLFCVLRLRVCCEGMSYWEQVKLMRNTDILLGVHGAGLLHVIHLNPQGRGVVFADCPATLRRRKPLVVHIGSVFLDFHEQTIISRLVSLSRGSSVEQPHPSLRYLSTATEPTVRDLGSTWRSPFALAADDLKGLWHHALWTYFLGD